MAPTPEKIALNRLRLALLTTMAGLGLALWAWAPIQQHLDPQPVCDQCQGTGLVQ